MLQGKSSSSNEVRCWEGHHAKTTSSVSAVAYYPCCLYGSVDCQDRRGRGAFRLHPFLATSALSQRLFFLFSCRSGCSLGAVPLIKPPSPNHVTGAWEIGSTGANFIKFSLATFSDEAEFLASPLRGSCDRLCQGSEWIERRSNISISKRGNIFKED